MNVIAQYKCFGGNQYRYEHRSTVLNCDMRFAAFIPSAAENGPVPVLFWLSGLTCTDENFIQKAGAQRYAEEHGIAIIAPDTSPRGDDVADASDGAYDLGLGAGFYVNANCEPWDRHYRMYDYVVDELPTLVAKVLPLDMRRQSVSGHSMGGHGALVIGLRNPGRYRSLSAFSPICAPSKCPWGEKVFSHYLGEDRSLWEEYDATKLVLKADIPQPILVDQGDADEFLEQQLKPELLSEACARSGYPLELRFQRGYDHSYYFIASFIGEHITFHASHLR